MYDATPYFNEILPQISKDGTIPEALIPTCPKCGSGLFGNVRGGSWFLSTKYVEESNALQKWMQEKIDSDQKVTAIEIGAGFNTPMVTRWPVESFVRELGQTDRGTLVRINPSDPEVPSDLRSLSLAKGWQVLLDLKCATEGSVDSHLEKKVIKKQELEGLKVPEAYVKAAYRQIGHFDWRRFLASLVRK